MEYLNLGFKSDKIYCAKPASDAETITINGDDYSKGYHVSASIDIFSHSFERGRHK